MSHLRSLLFFVWLSLSAAVVQFSQAQEAPSPAPSPPYDLDEAVALVTERLPGQVLRAETEQQDGRTVHRIRVLTDDSVVRTIVVDEYDGILEPETE